MTVSQDAVGETRLLLLLELQRVLGILGAAATMDTGRVGAAFERLVIANQVGPEATGLLGHGAGVTSHKASRLPELLHRE